MLFKSDGGLAFNEYSEFMAHNPIIRIIEIILFAGFIIHIVQSVTLTWRNNKARNVSYNSYHSPATSTWYSRNMGIFGAVIFVFLVIHLKDFFIQLRFTDEFIPPNKALDANGNVNLYDEVRIAFHDWMYVALYVVSMIFLAFHLVHGFQSSFQSLGINHPVYTPLIRTAGYLFATIIPAAFAAMPLYFYFFVP